MKILITNFWTQTNNGDAAILSSTLSFLRAVWPDSKIQFVTLHKDIFFTPELEAELSPTLHFLNTSAKGSGLRKYLEFFYSVIILSLWVFLFRIFRVKPNFLLNKNTRELVAAYVDCDMVFPIGGGYITASKGLRSTIFFILLFYPIVLALFMKKRVVMLWQSVGPFATWFQKQIASHVLRKVELIFARERYTLAMLREMKVPSSKVIDSGDIAFYFKPKTKDVMRSELASLGLNLDRPIVGITARHWFPAGSEAENRYIHSLNKSIGHLLKKGYQVVLLPQVTSSFKRLCDRCFLSGIKETYKDNSNVILPKKNYNHFEYKGIYENLSFLIGTRMHSNIFALTGLTPVLAVAYEYKTRGIMDDLGLSNFVVDIKDLHEDWIKEKLAILEKHRGEYLNILAGNLRQYETKLGQSREVLKNLFDF